MVRHLLAGGSGLGVGYVFWLTRPEWSPEMRFWKAVGDASLLLLYGTLVLGPAARLFPAAGRLLPIRRELGIWFGLFAILHTVLILNGWIRWNALRLMGYEPVVGLDRMVRLESGFGLANLLGIAAVALAVPLMATSTDWAMRTLGGSAWKFLHYSAYIIFYLVVLHTAYFLYVHFTLSFHREPPTPNWFRLPFVFLTAGVIALQVAAYIATARRRRRKAPGKENGIGASATSGQVLRPGAPLASRPTGGQLKGGR